MSLLFENKIRANKDAFIKKLLTVANQLGVSPNWLMAVFNSESNFDPRALNKTSGASGLLQWMPKTAKGLGTTTAQIRAMSNVQQLDYVLKYFLPFKHLINKYEDLYLITFYPNADGRIGGTLTKPDSWTFPNQVYLQNKIIDTDGDGKISIADFKRFVNKKIPANYQNFFKGATTTIKANSKSLTGLLTIMILALIFIYRKQIQQSLKPIWKRI